MNATALVEALREQREILAARWRRRFVANRAAAGCSAVGLSAVLAGALVDQVIAMLGESGSTRLPRRNHARAFARFASFPDSAAVCIDVFQAGAQVIGAFIVENAGSCAAWSISSRNRYLGELDAIFHVIVHRELDALCELLVEDEPDETTTPADNLASLFQEISERTLLRN